MILNLDEMPVDPLEQIVWLDQVEAAVKSELDTLYAEAYFEARLRGQFTAALKIGRASKKRALAWTRRENEKRGRSVRWNDGVDPTSTAYTG